jgi:2-dehydropantoate 2-reductase
MTKTKEGEESENRENTAAAAAPTNVQRANLNRIVLALRADGALRVSLTPNIRDVQYSKLLINLQSAVNALSREPVPATLSQRGYRLAWRGLIVEALEVYQAGAGGERR